MKFTNNNDGYGLVLSCPVCDDKNTHLYKVEPYNGVEERLAVTLSFTCEQGHDYSFNIHNHKGFTVSELERNQDNIEK